MDNELEVIRDEMEQTRANLADKLGALENQVRETVSGATEAVNSTVEGVKEVVSTVSETVETVTETFNVSKQVEQHPWMALGAAVATGFVIAQVLGRATASHQPAPAPVPPPPSPVTDLRPQPAAAVAQQPCPTEQQRPAAEEGKESGLLHSLESMMPDVSGVKSLLVGRMGELAVGGLMGLIREMAEHGLPKEWTGEATKLIDQVTTQLGGKPLDSARSGQLYGALSDLFQGRQGDGEQPREGQERQEGAPYDAVRQPSGVQQQQQQQQQQQREGQRRQEGAPYDAARQGSGTTTAPRGGTRGTTTTTSGRQPTTPR